MARLAEYAVHVRTTGSFPQSYLTTVKSVLELFSLFMTASFSFPRAPPPSPFNMLNPGDVWTPWGPRLRTIGEYFKYLQTPQTWCKKLVRMGGNPTCKRNVMDGHKVSNALQIIDTNRAILSSDILTIVESVKKHDMTLMYFHKIIGKRLNIDHDRKMRCCRDVSHMLK